MAANEVDELVGNQRRDLTRVVEQLAHGNGGAGLAAHHLEPLDLLGSERILVEEQTVLLQLLSQMDRVDGIEMLVHIVAEIDAKAEAVAHIIEQLGHAQLIAQRIVISAFARAVRTLGGQSLLISVSAVAAVLHADDLNAILHESLHAVADLFQSAAVRMAVNARSLAHLAAQQVINRHVGHLALDVPQRLIHAGDRVVEHGAVAPVSADHAHLPDVLNAGNILAHQQGLHVVGHRVGHGDPALGIGCAADAVKTRLRSDNLDDDQRNSLRRGADRVNVFDCNSHLQAS